MKYKLFQWGLKIYKRKLWKIKRERYSLNREYPYCTNIQQQRIEAHEKGLDFQENILHFFGWLFRFDYYIKISKLFND